MNNQFNQSTDWELFHKGFLGLSFLPYFGMAFADSFAWLGVNLFISTLAIAASIYSWRHNQNIRYLVMAFFVASMPIFLILLLLSLFFI
jgi:hypothetical protein